MNEYSNEICDLQEELSDVSDRESLDALIRSLVD